MKIKAVIFNEILYGPLSPWLSSNANETKFKELLNNQLRANKDNHFQYFKYLIDSFKYYSINLNITHISENIHSANIAKFAELQNNFSLFTIPVFYSKTSEFYYYLINNEYNRIRNAIAYNVKNSTDEIDSEFHVVNLLGDLEYLFEQFNEKKYEDKISLYVLNAMKLTLFRLYEEIKIVFPAFIGSEALTENEIINFIAPDFEIEKNDENTISYLIRQFIELRENLPVIVESSNKINLPVDMIYSSFTYKYLNTQQEYIKDLYDSLKLNNFIDKATNYIDFKKVFTGDRILKPVIWSGKISELNYFIKLIHNINKSVINLNQHQWEVACKCFIKSDGLDFERNNLKEQKKPKSTANLIEKVAAKLI